MSGPVASADSMEESILPEIKKARLNTILEILANNVDGLSNAALDLALGASSQWVIRDKVMKLLELGLIQYSVDFFGEPGRYVITPLGIKIHQVIQGITPSSDSD